jgi:hypothetical protein
MLLRAYLSQPRGRPLQTGDAINDTIPSAASTSSPRAHADAFADVVYQDDEFVRIEFDAIMAASWDTPPPPPPGPVDAADQGPDWPQAPIPEPSLPASRSPSGARLCHQRSPPTKKLK